MNIKVERDRSLVDSPCLRVRTNKYEHFIWFEGWRPKYYRWDRKNDE